MAEPTILVTMSEGGLWEPVPVRLLQHRSFFDACAAIRVNEKLVFDNILFRQGLSPFRIASDQPDAAPRGKLSWEEGES